VNAAHRRWSSEEEAALLELLAVGEPWPTIAASLGRSEDAVRIRARIVGREFLPAYPLAPAQAMDRWGRGRPPGGVRYWTRDRCLEALRAYAARSRGRLPVHLTYEHVKSGNPDLPPSHRLYEYFGSIARSWLVALPRRSWRRVPMLRDAWTQEEDDLLLELAGTVKLADIASRLHRSYGACRRRLYDRGISARDNQGYLSAQQVAEAYGCGVHRVYQLIERGVLRATLRHGNRYEIDPDDAAAVAGELRAPKRTHTSTPPAVGEYRKRYGIRRRAEEAAPV
jgi:hypothetical protein